jgi:Bacteriophage tail sheath protein
VGSAATAAEPTIQRRRASMPEHLAPGVYVEEVATGPRPIEGVSTSTTGFVGETERGPTRPRVVTSWEDYQRWFGGFIDRAPFSATNGFLPYAVRGFFENGGQRLFIARVTGLGGGRAAAEPASIQLAGTGGTTNVQAIGPGIWGNTLRIAVVPASRALATSNGIEATWFRIKVTYHNSPLPTPFIDPFDPAQIANVNRREADAFEDFDNLSADATEANFAMTVINDASRLITLTACPGAPTTQPNTPPLSWSLLTGGTSPALTDADYLDALTADPDLRRGLAGLAAIREVSIVAIPDAYVRTELSTNLQELCDNTRDRFAIHAVAGDSGDVETIQPLRDSSYGASYYPLVLVSAPHTQNGWRYVPPVGHVAGIYAHTDVTRGVHKAPANEVVHGIITRDSSNNQPLSHVLDEREQDILIPRGVNVIRGFGPDGREIRLLGARTMSSDGMWKYVNVRRLFIMVERSIDRGTQWVVFEPNTESTWTRVRSSIASFLRTLWLNGALMGTTEEEAFLVRCDRTTMTQDDIDQGRLVCLIGIAPVKPAEFVIFRIAQEALESRS